MEKVGGLGKGLRALIPEQQLADQKSVMVGDRLIMAPVDLIVGSRFQPRSFYDEASIHELAESIRQSGVIHPILIREVDAGGSDTPGRYELIAGERRLRAVKRLGLKEIPSLVKRVDDAAAARMGLIENIQREDLTAIEEARAYRRLQDEFGMTQETIAQAVGKDRVTVTNTLRLLQLPAAIQETIARGDVGMAHARALLGLPTERLQLKLLRMIVERGLSVRRVEVLVRQWTGGTAKRGGPPRDPHLGAAEEQLQQRLGTRVRIHHGRRRGWIRIEYYSVDDLNRILGVLRVKL